MAGPAVGWPGGPSDEELQQRCEHLQEAQRCLEAEAQQGAAELRRQAARQAELRQALEQGCTAAQRCHEDISVTLAALASRLDCLSTAQGQPPRLLALELPDSYAAACTALLDSLSGYVTHALAVAGDTNGGNAGEQQRSQQQQEELAQLQEGACKAERLRVAEEAEMGRLRAELEVLREPSATNAARLGYSSADLDAEVASLQRRQAAHLQQAQGAAEAAAAAMAGASAVEAQGQLAVIQLRVETKLQVAAMLGRHLARQLLVSQLLRLEEAAMQQAKQAVLGAREDAELALQAALGRLSLCSSGHQQEVEQAQHQQLMQVQPGQPVLLPQQQQQVQQQQAEQELGAAAAAEEAPAEEGAGADLVATAQQLLACRAEVQRLQEQLLADSLPAHQQLHSRLRRLLYGSGSSEHGEAGAAAGSVPVLTPPALREQLAAVAEAHAALSLQANAAISEVVARQSAPAERELAERALLLFWSQPEQLAALAASQRRKLELFA